MKKAFLCIAVISAFTSCKKDHTCTCSYTEPGSGVILKQTITYHKVSDKTAKTDCTIQTFTIVDSSGYATTLAETCVLN